MKVYVDSEIESCLDCPCHNGEHGHCQITGKYVCEYVPKSCPLQSLADYTKQVRKEVCEEIKDKLKLKEKFHPEDEFEIDYDFYYKEDVDELLNQIQGEEYDK